MLDENNVVRVTRYVKRHVTRDPVTQLTETRTVGLDWGIGDVNGGSGYYVYGPPQQLFAGEEGVGIADSHVLYADEILPASNLPSTSAGAFSTDTLHFKYPNI